MPITTSRIALVTGANKGIGLEIARQLGLAGLGIWVGARDASLGNVAARRLREERIDAQFVHLDLTDPTTIEAAAEKIRVNGGQLDVLVNNAGINILGDGPPSQIDVAVVRRVMDTNYFGALAVTQAMLPLLRQSRSARIVNVSSGLGSLTLNSDPNWEYAGFQLTGYNTSKAALNMLTVLLAQELRDTGISVNAVDPGFTATDLNGHRGRQTIPEGASEAVRLALLPTNRPTGDFTNAGGRNPW